MPFCDLKKVSQEWKFYFLFKLDLRILFREFTFHFLTMVAFEIIPREGHPWNNT